MPHQQNQPYTRSHSVGEGGSISQSKILAGATENLEATTALPSNGKPAVPRINRKAHSSSSVSNVRDTAGSDADAFLVSEARRLSVSAGVEAIATGPSSGAINASDEPGFSMNLEKQPYLGQIRPAMQQQPNHLNHVSKLDLNKIDTPRKFQNQRRSTHHKQQNFHNLHGQNNKSSSNTAFYQQQELRRVPSHTSATATNPNLTAPSPFKTPSKSPGLSQQYPLTRSTSSTLSRNSSTSLHSSSINNMATPSRPPRSHNSFSSFRQSSHRSNSSSSLTVKRFSTSTNKSNSSSSNTSKFKFKVSKLDPRKYQNHTFQHPSNAMRVSVRNVDLANRVAFETRLGSIGFGIGASTSVGGNRNSHADYGGVLSSITLKNMLLEMERVRSTASVISSSSSRGLFSDGGVEKRKRSENPCRISPSPNHLAIIEFLHGTGPSLSTQGKNGSGTKRVVRQLQWNAASSVDADPWFDSLCDKDEIDVIKRENGSSDHTSDEAATSSQSNRYLRNRKLSSSKTQPHGIEGRYIPINPLSDMKANLPNHSPLLTHCKRRLPMRSDVGFANPTEEEVSLKMEECKKESEWEESSPRIVLMASGFPSLQNERIAQNYSNHEEGEGESDHFPMVDELHPSCRKDAKLWAGGAIPGLPFAGRDLIMVYKISSKWYDQRKDIEGDRLPLCSSHSGAYSMFAPPVDATFSTSHLWRPRPFMDRPPGFVYFLACPLDVRFKVGDIEPLYCTMALYTLPTSTSSDGRGRVYDEYGTGGTSDKFFAGKISEDFFFPAGDWNSLDDDRTVANDGDDDGDQQAWRRRKRRAVMAFDPLDVSPRSLYLVFQFSIAARTNAIGRYLQSTTHDNGTFEKDDTASRKNTLLGKLKRPSLLSKGKSIEIPCSNELEPTAMKEDLRGMIEEGTAKFLTPLCFSVVPAFPSPRSPENQQWPLGESTRAPFYSFPEVPESQEDFTKRLITLAQCQESNLMLDPQNESRSCYRLDPLSPQQSSGKMGSVPIAGWIDVFTSFLGGDFTRSLLEEPPELSDTGDDAVSPGPQLLADVMGDCAISFDGTSGGDVKKKRSRLRRLPPSPDSGYSSSFDLKEVLFLSPRSAPRKYDDDVPLCSSTVLNLLYVYPKLIRNQSDGPIDSSTYQNERWSLCIRLVEQELTHHEQSFDSTDGVYEPMSAIYNPVSPSGPPLVESFLTKISALPILFSASGTKSINRSKGNKREVSLNDEIKIRLPQVLDRRHFIQFTLLSVNISTDIVVAIAETTVPLVISSKEATSRGRITTVIPNGLHRIQLGEDYQVHIETRLASSLHISDPSVATILRDYPLLTGGDSNDGVVHKPSGVPFVDILSMASGQAVRRHFLPLVTANMINFVNETCPPFYFESLYDIFGNGSEWHRLVASEKTDSLSAIIRSLIDILDKTRTSFLEKEHSIVSLHHQRTLKSFLDFFDERLFFQRDSSVYDAEQTNSMDEKNLDDSIEGSTWHNGSFFEESNVAIGDPFLSANSSFDNRRTRMQKYHFRSPRNHTGQVPFTRRAYVASRTEQLKAEAEMYDEDLYTNQYFDDDETVMTFGTMTSRSVYPVVLETKKSTLDNSESFPAATSATKARIDFQTSKETTPSNRSSPSTEPFSFTSTPAKFVANRVNNVAQLVIAPCMAPSLSEVISCGMNSSPRHQMTSSSGNARINSDHIVSNTGFSSGKSPFEPSSDVENEDDPSGFHLAAGDKLIIRGNHSCFHLPRLILHPIRNNISTIKNDDESIESNSQQTYLYEVLIVLWLQSWTAVASSIDNCDRQLRGSSKAIPTWPFEIILGINNPSTDAVVAFSFVRHLAFFLPLCFKSLVLRCTNEETSRLLVPMTFLDDSHMQILVPIVETTALGILREALSGSGGASNADQMMTKALIISDVICDFFAGLFAVLHPSQMHTLLLSYFNILQECESATECNRNRTIDFHANLRVIKCVRQIRLHAVERLATMPRFLSLNFPIKYTGAYPKHSGNKSTWQCQTHNDERENNLRSMMLEINRDPQCFWLAEILMDECLDICHRSCEAIIIEAQVQSKVARRGRKVDDHISLSRSDLLRMESIAYHSIICVYELLIKRHAMDSRFQSIDCNTRVAGMFVDPVLEHVINASSVLATMEGSHRVRCLWLLSLVYILQEGPEVLIRNKLREFCRPVENRIFDFISILKMSSITFQYFIQNERSLPIIGGLTKEFIQETFNCLAATVILLIDECFDIFSRDYEALESSAAAVFDLLLHMLSSPQSSVTLLRTLGGSAHSLDKFGARAFLSSTGHRFQHWGRIILSLMNSTELSVRSMAVDFFVSLIGGAFNDIGSIDAEMTCILTVMPEVVAREIALYSVSGLLNTMDDVESCMWPLRRALADVEDTNPLDDDRIDPQLMPSIRTLCRTGQAIIDGVLIEMRLCVSDTLDLERIMIAQQQASEGNSRCIGTGVDKIFDADEESLYEATNYFSSESSLSQKLRWLLTLRDLHVTKNQWLEAAETLVHCSRSVIQSFEFIANHWRPSQFDLWNDYRRSPWLSSIRLIQGNRDHGNVAVMKFAKSFLEPGIGLSSRPSMDDLCSLVDNLLNEALSTYTKEDGLEELAYAQFEELLCIVSEAIKFNTQRNRYDLVTPLRRVRSMLCKKISALTNHASSKSISGITQRYVRVILSGDKPDRFKESTTIPTFLEWRVASICRVTQAVLSKANNMMKENSSLTEEECICLAYAEPFVKSLRKNKNGHDSIVLRTRGFYNDLHAESGKTYFDVRVVQMRGISRFFGGARCFKSRRFYLRYDDPGQSSSNEVDMTEFTVANRFPHVMSRQRSLITSEIKRSHI